MGGKTEPGRFLDDDALGKTIGPVDGMAVDGAEAQMATRLCWAAIPRRG